PSAGNPMQTPPPPPNLPPALSQGDFVKAISLLVLIDSQYLTTRTNTFTSYVSVIDRENPENSVRSQVTFDRSNLLPSVVYEPSPVPWGTTTGQFRNDAPLRVKLLDRLNNATGNPYTGGPFDGFGDTPMRLEPTSRTP